MWPTETQNSTETGHQCLQINCNGNNYNVGNMSGLELVEKVKSIARENYINKYDILDSTNTKISPAEVEVGNFTGPLTVMRFNVAA
jgi:hypothetical protein